MKTPQSWSTHKPCNAYTICSK